MKASWRAEVPSKMSYKLELKSKADSSAIVSFWHLEVQAGGLCIGGLTGDISRTCQGKQEGGKKRNGS